MNALIILPIFFFLLLYKYKRNTIAVTVLVFYLLGSIMSMVMVENSLFPSSVNFGHQPPSIAANLFLIVCLYIAFLPIFNIKQRANGIFHVNITNLYIFSSILIILSLFYIYWMAPHITEALDAVGDFATYKSDVADDSLTFSRNNPIIGWLFSIQVALRTIIIFLFCLSLYLNLPKIYRFMMGFIAIVPPVVQALATAYRNELVFVGIDFFMCYIFFRKYYSPRLRKNFFVVVIGCFSVMVLGITVLFAVLRFSANGYDNIVFSLERYYGEPFVNFNTMLWGEEDLLWGNKCFVVVRKYLGLSYITPRKLIEMSHMFKYQTNYFYGFVGNFYQDFGAIGSIILCSVISYIVIIMQKILSSVRNFLSSNLFNFIYSILIVRCYFYFIYVGYNFLTLVFLLIGFWCCHRFIFKIYSPISHHKYDIL